MDFLISYLIKGVYSNICVLIIYFHRVVQKYFSVPDVMHQYQLIQEYVLHVVRMLISVRNVVLSIMTRETRFSVYHVVSQNMLVLKLLSKEDHVLL